MKNPTLFIVLSAFIAVSFTCKAEAFESCAATYHEGHPLNFTSRLLAQCTEILNYSSSQSADFNATRTQPKLKKACLYQGEAQAYSEKAQGFTTEPAFYLDVKGDVTFEFTRGASTRNLTGRLLAYSQHNQVIPQKRQSDAWVVLQDYREGSRLMNLPHIETRIQVLKNQTIKVSQEQYKKGIFGKKQILTEAYTLGCQFFN